MAYTTRLDTITARITRALARRDTASPGNPRNAALFTRELEFWQREEANERAYLASMGFDADEDAIFHMSDSEILASLEIVQGD